MKKLILFLLFSCTKDLTIEYSNEGITSKITKAGNYTKELYRYMLDDEQIISKIDTFYTDTEKGRIIDYYLVTSISANSIYQRLINKNSWDKNYYHHISTFLYSIRNLRAEVEGNKFKNIVLAEDKDELEKSENGTYDHKRYEINKVKRVVDGSPTKIIFMNTEAKEEEKNVIDISYQKIENMEDVFVKEKEIENYFAVKAIVRDLNKDKETIGVYFHFYDIAHKNIDLDELLPFADNPKDIKLTIVRNKDLTGSEKITVSNNFRIFYNGNVETLKGKDDKILYENIANSSSDIENTLSFYTILDRTNFIKNFANKEGFKKEID